MHEVAVSFDRESIKLADLLENFEYHLKRKEGISGFPKAHRQREDILEKVRDYIQKKWSKSRSLTMDALYESAKSDAAKRAEIKYLFNYLDANGYGPSAELGLEAEEAETVTSDSLKLARAVAGAVKESEKVQEPPVIGRVAPTVKSPARPGEFVFWVTEDRSVRESVAIEPGRLVSATPDDNNVSVLGIINDVEAQCDMVSPAESFYGYGVGNPTASLPTEPVVITIASVEVVYRSDKKAEPITGQWKVRPATGDEIRKSYGSEISEDNELLLGFSNDWMSNLVPIPADIRHVLGYEAAHVNISGAAGAATKTSYALFLLYSILSQSRAKSDKGLRVAAIAFNVKEADLLRIDQLPLWEEIEEWSRGGPRAEHARFWKGLCSLQEPYSINPWQLKERFKFFVPQRADGRFVTLRDKDWHSIGFRYAALDLAETRSLHLLLDPEDLDDKATAVLWSLMDEITTSRLTFDGALSRLQQSGQAGGGTRWVTIGGAPHHADTVYKVRNRAEHAVRYQLTDLLAIADRVGKPIPIWSLQPGELWVVDISRLPDKGQRLVFHWVIRAIHDFLEKKRTGDTGTKFLQQQVDLSAFPDRVVIFVDELNKFAPWGAEASAIKRDIVEITARGRSIGLSLIGAQQLASRVDEEILANTSTFVVGRSHPIEIARTAYGWLPKGLKERATTLDRGTMIAWHGAHKRPVFIRFPKPPHML